MTRGIAHLMLNIILGLVSMLIPFTVAFYVIDSRDIGFVCLVFALAFVVAIHLSTRWVAKATGFCKKYDHFGDIDGNCQTCGRRVGMGWQKPG